MHSYQQGWKCKICDADNWKKHKVCWTCKAIRSYAEVVSSQAQDGQQQVKQQAPLQPKPGSSGRALHQQIADIASQLGSTISSATTSQAEAPSQGHSQVQEVNRQTQEPERQIHVARIRQLETSLASIPEGPEFKHIKDAILVQIEQAKAKVNSSKPLAARLEGCQEALNRAQKRLTETQSLMELATAAREQAKTQVAKYQSELAEVQSLISQQAEATRGGTCLQKLHQQMEAVLSEMSGSSHLELGETQNVMQQMGTLFSQLTGLATKAQLSAQVCQEQEKLRLQQLFLENAAAKTVDTAPSTVAAAVISSPMAVDLTAESQAVADSSLSVGELANRVITGGG